MEQNNGQTKTFNSARIFGAEARANQRSLSMTKDDRDDLIHTAGVSKWGDLPKELCEELQAAFNEGFQAESKHYYG